jgi:hypothetical protein
MTRLLGLVHEYYWPPLAANIIPAGTRPGSFPPGQICQLETIPYSIAKKASFSKGLSHDTKMGLEKYCQEGKNCEKYLYFSVLCAIFKLININTMHSGTCAMPN